MNITLTFKQLQFIAYHLRDKSIGTDYGRMYEAIRAAVDENTLDDDEVTFQITPHWVASVWGLLENKPQGVSSAYNLAIRDRVETQLTTILQSQPGGGVTEDGEGKETYTPEKELAIELEKIKATTADKIYNILQIGKTSIL